MSLSAISRPRKVRFAGRFKTRKPRRLAAFPMWLMGFLCLAFATILHPLAQRTYLLLFTGAGVWVEGSAPFVQGALCLLIFALHALSVWMLGLAGFLILYRAWHPGAEWRVRTGDPQWLAYLAYVFNVLSRGALRMAWRGTLLAMLVCLYSWGYLALAEAWRLTSTETDLLVGPIAFHLILWLWPLTFLALSNLYAVQKHFLGKAIDARTLVRPQDVLALMDPRDTKKPDGEAKEKSRNRCKTLAFWLERILSFSQARTCVLRHRTAQIGHTDVHFSWWSQQLLRLYRFGKDPRLSESSSWSFALHVGIVLGPLVLAFLASFTGCTDAYLIPAGPKTGPPSTRQKQQRVHYQRIERKVLVNPFSSILIATFAPDQINEGLEEATEHAYVRSIGTGTGTGSGGGVGGGGNGPGRERGTIRFLTLQHNGADWDRARKYGGDTEMLKEFGRRAGCRIAHAAEDLTPEKLLRFHKDQSPPFLYVTGRKPFSLNTRDARILHDYLLHRGGMLIGDSPGESFSHSFRAMVGQILSSQALWIEIPDDDPLYQGFYSMPGCPPLWHHDGHRALGIRHEGRWIVFYHPGDMADAWRTGHSGTSPESAEMAYRMGVNLMDYALRNAASFQRGKF